MNQTYTNIYYEHIDNSLKGKLKPISCQSCRDNGEDVGSCKTCLENQAYNREYLETHTFKHDSYYRPYHYDGHRDIKRLPLRLPNEHPYLYYGIELEVEFDSSELNIYDEDNDYYDDEEENNDNWKLDELLDEFSDITDGLFCYEKDGSLDNGVEFISRPCSYAFWTSPETVEKLQKGLDFLRDHGAYWDQPSTNGMHIHISRKFFDKGETKLSDRQDAYRSFDWLFQKFQPELEKIGGREYTHYCQSKAKKIEDSIRSNVSSYTYNGNVELKMQAKIKKGGELAYNDHYSAVNLGNTTIEARIFKSTTDYKQVLANIELVRNFAHAVREENIEKTLNELLHTKDNLYLDEQVRKINMECRRKKDELDLEKKNNNEIEINIEQ